jgi:hypothetical protein
MGALCLPQQANARYDHLLDVHRSMSNSTEGYIAIASLPEADIAATIDMYSPPNNDEQVPSLVARRHEFSSFVSRRRRCARTR